MSDLISRSDAIDAVMKYKMPFSIQQEVAREIDALPSADAEPKWNCTASFVAEQLERLRNMTDEEKWEFFRKFFGMGDAVHGEWVCKEREYNDCDGHYAYYWYECSVCGSRPPKDTWKNEWHSNYCPSCGSKMYKGGDDE